ncbi:hypothetical protein KJK34_07200 [Flavobacterium sp. D11R37]|uniref:hypothetical protein n=1 Tax=Flavobacterium coralii TaxID=2838017 RepID=UPI001CA75E39|nr:hypothetical protein [Flavobacterium coralii]MBY8962536.1 hypothetical protein [Flavobacterium coralii]
MKKLLYILPIFLLLSCEEIILEDDISDERINLVAPADDAQFYSTGITFTWDPIENGTQYRIQIAKPDFDSPMQIVADNIIDTTSFTTQLNIGQYQWRVQAVNSGYATAFATRSLTVVSNEDFESNTVSLLIPQNNLVTNNNTQNLTWQPVIGAATYKVQIINSTTSTTVHEQDVNAASLAYTFSNGNFHWKVRASNAEGQNTMFSSRSLLVDTQAPNTPTLTSPVNLSISSDNNVTFEWNRTSLAGSTETDSLYIYNNSQLTDLEYKNIHTSPYTNSTLPDGTYHWFVKSFDAAGNAGAQSQVFSFTLN